MSSSMQLAPIWIQSLWYFSRNFTSSIVLEFWVKALLTKLYLTHTYKSKGGIWAMHVQFNLEVICKKKKRKGIPSNFQEFKVKKFIVKNTQEKKRWCLNVIILWIPWNDKLLLPQVPILWFLEKIISPTMSQTALFG
jgi:hypothetical protein